MRGGKPLSAEEYAAKAVEVPSPYGLEKPCLIHPSSDNPARKIYLKRHGPTGLFVCHKCDNRRCVEDSHHFLGTCADNCKDASSKGRLVRSQESKDALRHKMELWSAEIRADINRKISEAKLGKGRS